MANRIDYSARLQTTFGQFLQSLRPKEKRNKENVIKA